MQTKVSNLVPIELFGQLFYVAPNGDIQAERPRVSGFQLDQVRLSAAAIFIQEKQRYLSKSEREFWRNVKRPSERLS